MSADGLRRYRFATEAQWKSCLLVQTDSGVLRASGGIRPFTPFAATAALYESSGARAPVVTGAGEILWHDEAGSLYRLEPGDDMPIVCSAPSAIAGAARIASAPGRLWVTGAPPDSLQSFEDDSLARVLTTAVAGARVVDVAGDGRGSIWALVERDASWLAVRFDCSGGSVERVPLAGISGASAFAFLARAQRFVVLAGERHPHLYWFEARGGKPLFVATVSAMRPCFTATALGSDSRDRVFLAGLEGQSFGGGAHVLAFDGDGNSLGEVPLNPRDAPATGVTATRELLLVTGARGLLRFSPAEAVPENAGEAGCMVVTPVLDSPDREDGRRWLRAEASVDLPGGSTLEISIAATDDAAVRDRLVALATDASQSASSRARALLGEPGIWRTTTTIHGSDPPPKDPAPISAKLFDVRERYIWVCIRLTAAAGGRLPALSELAVVYPGRTLMQNLPAIYQREESKPGSFLRGLVGVLEATTQELDGHIASMGARVNPSTAEGRWLDFVARWLGVPWDDALTNEQKRAIVTRAEDFAKGRGTRAGLEALLQALMPGTPRRFRVTDATADFGFAIVGGAACGGSTLPAMLGGRTRWSGELGSTAVLGHMRLPCAGQGDDGTGQLAGLVRIDVAATAAERKAWEPWLRGVIMQMVPLTARVTIRWVAARALREDRLDGTLTLDSPPVPHLGTDAVTDLARLPERGARLSPFGPAISTRLR